MYILAIETTGPFGSVALIDKSNNILGHRMSRDHMNHLKDLVPMIDGMLKELGIRKEEITAIACDVGPGSFTGIRIGVSSARALAQVLEIPCISVSSLSSALLKDSAIEIAKDDTKVVTVIHNARRRQVYGFMDGFLTEGPWLIDDIIRSARESLKDKTLYFYGDGICVVEWADIIEELLPEDAAIFYIERGASEEEREYRIEGAAEDLCIF